MPSNGKVLLAYCIEKSFEPGIISFVLEHIGEIHRKIGIRATLFITGRALESNFHDLIKFRGNKFFDFAGHSFNHIGLKPNLEDRGDGSAYIPASSIDEIERDLKSFNELYFRIFEKKCLGFCSPRGFYRGFADRPDLLQIVRELGYKYLITWTRNHNDWFPCLPDIQPFFYAQQGYPDILEIPTHGWQDAGWVKVKRETIKDEFWLFQKKEIKKVLKSRERVFGFALHDWVIYEEFKDNGAVEGFYKWVMENNIEPVSYEDYYLIAKSKYAA